MHSLLRIFTLAPLAWCLFSCSSGGSGGGSSGSGGASTPAPVTFPQTAPVATILNTPDDSGFVARRASFENADEYHVQYARISDPTTPLTDTHLDRIGAAAAYARGATGNGERGLVIDTGIRGSHREFSGIGKLTQEAFYPSNSYSPDPGGSASGHGTFVASVMAGRRGFESGLNMHGVAFDASIHFAYLPLGSGSSTLPDYSLTDLESFVPSQVEDASRILALAVSSNSSVVNLSFGVPNTSVSRFVLADLQRILRPLADALAQADIADANKTILVWAAGNDGGRTIEDGTPVDFDSPGIFKTLAYPFPELRKHTLVVAALDQDGTIASYSNRCGLAKVVCLAAPGSDIVAATYFGDLGYTVSSGTSSAAPIVSGALLVLREYFRGQLGNTELVARLLATANRTGIYADSDVYGHGLLDLDAATRPVGTAVMGRNHAPVAHTLLEVPSAYGNSVSRGLRGIELVGFDSLNAPFFYPANRFVAHHRPLRGFAGWLSDEAVSEESTLLPNIPWYKSAFGLRMTGYSGVFAFSGRLASKPDHMLGGLRAGLLVEQGSHQQAKSSGAFGYQTDSRLAFLGYEKIWSLGDWSVEGHLLLATGKADYASTGAFSASGSFYSSARLMLNHSLPTTRTQLKLEQPLRAESGSGEFEYAYSRTLNGDYLYTTHSFSLVPDARALHLGLQHERLLPVGEIAFSLNYALNAQHVKGQQDAWIGAGYRWRW